MFNGIPSEFIIPVQYLEPDFNSFLMYCTSLPVPFQSQSMSVTSLVKTLQWQAYLKKSLPVKQISVRCIHSSGPISHEYQSKKSHHMPRLTAANKKSFDQLQSLRKTLNEHPEHVLRILNLVENVRLSTCEHIRLGNRGSLAVSRERTERSGQGLWYNFETNESGDMMDLVRDTKQFKRDQVI